MARGANTIVTVDALQSISIASADTQSLVIDSGAGDDVINVTSNGGPALTVIGGDPTASDTLTVTANGDTTVNFGSDPTSGTITTDDPAIAFSGIEAISLTSATGSALTVNGTNGDDAINQSGNTVTVNNGATVTFASYPTLNLNGNNGDDVFNVWPTTLAGVTAFNVDGGDPTASDKLIVNGTAGADSINFTPELGGCRNGHGSRPGQSTSRPSNSWS